MVSLPRKSLLALLPFYLVSQVFAGASGTGTTTRYWDCCKPSCAWPGKTTLESGATPVGTCDISGNPITDYNAVSGCNGGTAFMPAEQSPWAVDDNLAYGFAAVNIAGGDEASWCCACYELTFTSGAVAGKKMIVQATNTGGDLGSNQFDIAMPGGGVGIFNGCTTQWGAPSSGWGAQYGGIATRSDCDDFPDALKPGCYWRFDFFENADNPSVSFEQVTCPAALTAKTGCVRAGEVPSGSSSIAAVSSSTSAAAPVASSSSSDAPVVAESTSTEYSSSSIATSALEATTPSESAPGATQPIETSSSSVAGSSSTIDIAPVASSSASAEPTTTVSSTTTTYQTSYVHKTHTTVSVTSADPFDSTTSIATLSSSGALELTTVSVALPATSAPPETFTEQTIYTTISACPAETSSVFEPTVTVTVYTTC